MKKLSIIFIVLISLLMGNILNAQSVGISSSIFTPDASAGLDVNFTDKGLLIPRVSLSSTNNASPITSPATSLLVYNTATTGDVTPGYYYWDGSQWVRFATGSSVINGSGAATRVAFWSGTNTLSSNANLYWDNTNSRLGIGTITPNATLEINGPVIFGGGNANLDPSGYLYSAITSALPNSGKFVIGWNYAAGGGETDFIANRGGGGIGGFKFYDYTNTGVLNHLLTIEGNGNVGIGIISPAYKLDVVGDIRSTGEHISTLGSGYGQFRAIGGNYGAMIRNDGIGTYLLLTNQGDQYGGFNALRPIIINDTTGNLCFANCGVFMRHSDGYVGIGTISPTAKLDINGTFKLVDGTQGANKVLTSDANGLASWQPVSGGIMQWITPIVILNNFTGHHSACTAWQASVSPCGCGYEPYDGYCVPTYVTVSYNNGCPCATNSSYPADQTNYSWQTVNLSSLGLPSGIKQLYIEIDYAINDNYGDADTYVLVRQNSSSPTYPVARGRYRGSSDANAGVLNSTMIPIDPSTNSFQYAVVYPGFGGGVTIRILAYMQ